MIKPVCISDKEVNQIVYQYYLDHHQNHATAMREYKKLNTMLVSADTQLVRSGDIVFLLVFAQAEAEFHSMGKATSAFAFIRSIYQLIDYVKSLNLRAIKTYGANPVFERLFSRVSVAATRDIQVGPDGNTYSYYRLEF